MQSKSVAKLFEPQREQPTSEVLLRVFKEVQHEISEIDSAMNALAAFSTPECSDNRQRLEAAKDKLVNGSYLLLKRLDDIAKCVMPK